MLIKTLGMLGGITYTGDYPVRPTDDAISGKAILMESVFTTGGAIFGTPVPKVTAATVFTGTFNAMAAVTEGDAMLSTKFGVMFSDKPLEVKGSFKYTAGTPFYNKEGVEIDKKMNVLYLLFSMKWKMKKKHCMVETFIQQEIL